MPTASRLVAAICLGLVAWILSGLIVPLLPEGSQVGWFFEVNSVIGICVGWTVMGSRVGRGSGLGNGLTGVAALLFWGLLVHSVIQMVRISMRKRYDGPMEALTGAVDLAIGFGQTIASPGVIVAAVAGGLMAGWATEQAGKRWP